MLWANWIEPLASTRVELELLRGSPDEARCAGEAALDLAADNEQVFYTARLHALTARSDALIAERARAVGDETAAAEAADRANALCDRIARRLEPEGWRGSLPPETAAYRETCAAEALRGAGAAAPADWAAVADRWNRLGLRARGGLRPSARGGVLVLDGERNRPEEAVAAGLG